MKYQLHWPGENVGLKKYITTDTKHITVVWLLSNFANQPSLEYV